MPAETFLNALAKHRGAPIVAPEKTRGREEEAQLESLAVDGGEAKRWPPWARALLLVMSAGEFNVTAAVRKIEPDEKKADALRRHVYRLRGSDGVFAERMDEARDAALDLVERRMVEAATSGIPEETVTVRILPDGTKETITKKGHQFVPTAGMFVLKRWRPEYRDTYKTEVTGADGGPVQIESLDYIDRQIAMLAAELARRGKPLEPSDLIDREPADDASIR